MQPRLKNASVLGEAPRAASVAVDAAGRDGAQELLSIGRGDHHPGALAVALPVVDAKSLQGECGGG